jgi:hypothetical protein
MKTALGALLGALLLASPAAAFQTVGREAPESSNPTNCVPNGTFIQRGLDAAETDPYVVPSDGVIVQWRTRVGNLQSGTGARLEVWRFVSGDTFSYVGGSRMEQPLTSGTLNVMPTRVAVKQDDVIAIHTSADNGGPCVYDTPGVTANSVGFGQYTGTKTAGDTQALPPNNPTSRVNVSAMLEPDADHDGWGDESQDNCLGVSNPTNLDTDHDGKGNACDADDDNDGVVDSKDAFPLNKNETVDSDRDGKGDNGDKDDDNDGLKDAAEKARGTNRLDRDSDDDGILDGTERKTNPAKADTDGDGLRDGLEKGVTKPVPDPPGPVLGTLKSKFRADKDPTTTTNPTRKDTDADGVSDGKEDKNHNGRVDANETSPRKFDTDGDGVTDGKDKHPRDPSRG